MLKTPKMKPRRSMAPPAFDWFPKVLHITSARLPAWVPAPNIEHEEMSGPTVYARRMFPTIALHRIHPDNAPAIASAAPTVEKSSWAMLICK